MRASFERPFASVENLFDGGHALIIVPPFGGIDRPSLAAHLLQASAAQRGLRVHVLYANLHFAASVGESSYVSACYGSCSSMVGERIFAAAAYDIPSMGWSNQGTSDIVWDDEEVKCATALEASAISWADYLATAIVTMDFVAVGCSTTFEQTAASIALLNRIKSRSPSTVTMLGGANCDGEMARGIRTLSSAVDFVFSGESEQTFPRFLEALSASEFPRESIICGEPCMDLDSLATPRFDEYYQQLALFLPDSSLRGPSSAMWLPYETSRGCWWGAKNHCTFCGLNAQTMTHREKTHTKVLDELDLLVKTHPTRNVCMVDNIMPRSYFKTLLLELPTTFPDLHIFYEQKANLSFAEVGALKRAGVNVIQPGIESLSTSLLARMRKGVSTPQNILLLRLARAWEVAMNWNLLYGFPNDTADEYEDMLSLLPLLHHLNPPGGVSKLSIDRFSPYFDHPADFGIQSVRPIEGYADVLPRQANIDLVAYHFTGDYESGILRSPDLIIRLEDATRRWRERWEAPDGAPPALAVTQVDDDTFMVLDTRDLPGTDAVQFIDRDQAALVLGGSSCDQHYDWAVERKLLAPVDSRYIALATADPELLELFLPSSRSVSGRALPIARACPT